MLSGHLAARALLAGRPEDYDGLWKLRLSGLLRTGIVNRFLYRKLGDRGYTAFLRILGRTADPRLWLGRQYRPSLLTKALYPVARRAVRTSRRETPCVEEGCECTWCRCGRDEAPAERSQTPSEAAVVQTGAAP